MELRNNFFQVKFDNQELNIDKMREEMELMRKTIEEKNKIIHELSIQSSSSASSSGMNLVAVPSPGSQAMSLTSSDLTSSTETITSEVSNLTNELFQSRNHFKIEFFDRHFGPSCSISVAKIIVANPLVETTKI